MLLAGSRVVYKIQAARSNWNLLKAQYFIGHVIDNYALEYLISNGSWQVFGSTDLKE
jgi:hypothetical protein